MVAVTQGIDCRVFGREYTRKVILDTSAAAACTGFKGEPIVLEIAAGDTVNPRYCHGVADPEMKPTSIFMGIAKENHTNVISSAETLTANGIEIWVEPTIVGIKLAALTNASAGKTVYYVTGTIDVSTATDTPPIGKLMWVDGDYAYVMVKTAISTGAGA